MESTKNDRLNGSPGAALDMRTAFSLVDPATGRRRTVREMTDAEIERHLRDVAQQVMLRINASMQSFVRLIPALDDAPVQQCLQLLEQSRHSSGFLMVLQYEQNRRANVGAIALPPGVGRNG